MVKLHGEHLNPFDTPLGRSIVASVKARGKTPPAPPCDVCYTLDQREAYAVGFTVGYKAGAENG